MIKRFIKYISDNHLFNQADTILVGVSGGVDSVVLLDLLDKAGISVAIAHCNFRLRGSESDGDEKLVADLARKYDVPLFKTAFDTVDYAQENKFSIEMAARELRYQWFEMIRTTHHFDCIAVAHHRDDQLETFFLNLARGTGLTGLTGNPYPSHSTGPIYTFTDSLTWVKGSHTFKFGFHHQNQNARPGRGSR